MLLLDPRTLQPIQGPPLTLVTCYGEAKMIAVRNGADKGATSLIGSGGLIPIALPGRLVPTYIDAVRNPGTLTGMKTWNITHWFVEVDGQHIGVLAPDGSVLRRDLQWAEGVWITPTIRAVNSQRSATLHPLSADIGDSPHG